MLMSSNVLASLKFVTPLSCNSLISVANARNVLILPILMRLEKFVFLTSANRTRSKISKENAKNVNSTFILMKMEKLAFRIHVVQKIMSFF